MPIRIQDFDDQKLEKILFSIFVGHFAVLDPDPDPKHWPHLKGYGMLRILVHEDKNGSQKVKK
jgi:hypothetical protein